MATKTIKLTYGALAGLKEILKNNKYFKETDDLYRAGRLLDEILPETEDVPEAPVEAIAGLPENPNPDQIEKWKADTLRLRTMRKDYAKLVKDWQEKEVEVELSDKQFATAKLGVQKAKEADFLSVGRHPNCLLKQFDLAPKDD